jgi:hypothetical protein
VEFRKKQALENFLQEQKQPCSIAEEQQKNISLADFL